MSEAVYEVLSHDGLPVRLNERTWRHIVVRHPEPDNRLSAVSSPDEVYLDRRGARHVLKALMW